jgi:hypothetical protein
LDSNFHEDCDKVKSSEVKGLNKLRSVFLDLNQGLGKTQGDVARPPELKAAQHFMSALSLQPIETFL